MNKSRKAAVLKMGNSIKKNWALYLFLVPAIVLTFCFRYIPMYGVQIAFKDYSIGKGIMGSPWIGFKHFERLFNLATFKQILVNTVKLSLFGMLANYPLPIILALFLNQMKYKKFKSFLQTATYMPHFISLVVMVGMINIFLSPSSGIYGAICREMGIEAKVILGKPELFRPIYIISGLWQHVGWNSIIYLAALSGVDPALHESAMMDGASKLKRILYIDLPSIAPTSVIMLIMSVGNIMNVGFEKAFLMQNTMNLSSSEIISTYIYKVGIVSAQYSLSSAVGLFNNVIDFVMLVLVNWFSKKVSETSLW